MIRQQLMCNVDPSILGHFWWSPAKAPNRTGTDLIATADFNSKQHVCRDYDAIMAWVDQRAIHDEDRPEDFLVTPAPGSFVPDHVP
jgi:hypothetical protein